MISSPMPESSVAEDPVAATLNNEIASLQAQIQILTSHRALQASTILSSHTTLLTLANLRKQQTQKPNPSLPTSTSTSTPTPETTDLTPLLTISTALTTHTTTNLYRTCASITSFPLTDPDPHAVNHGSILALRFDISLPGGKFGKSHYVMLNRPFGGADTGEVDAGGEGGGGRGELLRVHRHTLPPCIPLQSIARKYLPNGKGGKKQDLTKFARALRRELVGYQKRIATIKSLRKEFALDEKKNVSTRSKRRGGGEDSVIEDIAAADAEAKQIKIIWTDGKVGRVLVGERGEVAKCVVVGEGGRERDVERRVMGGVGRRGVEGIGGRIMEGVY